MRLLVTGAAGFIGATFVYECLKKGHIVFGLDNFSNSNQKNIDIFLKIFPESFTFLEVDIAKNKSKLESVMKKFEPEHVIHFAGLKAVDESEEKPDLYWKNNVGSTSNLLETMPAKVNLIFSSSATVYGNNINQPLSEDSEVEATSVYGATKIASEKLITEYSKTKGIRSICLRYFNPVGSHSDRIITEDYKNKPNNLMPKLIETAKNKTNIIQIFGSDYETRDGTGERDYIHIIDLIDGHLLAIEKVTQIEGTRTYNLGTGKSTTVIELVDTFNRVNKLKVKKNFVERRSGDIGVCYADPSRAEKELNWAADFNLDQMCKDSWEAVNE